MIGSVQSCMIANTRTYVRRYGLKILYFPDMGLRPDLLLTDDATILILGSCRKQLCHGFRQSIHSALIDDTMVEGKRPCLWNRQLMNHSDVASAEVIHALCWHFQPGFTRMERQNLNGMKWNLAPTDSVKPVRVLLGTPKDSKNKI